MSDVYHRTDVPLVVGVGEILWDLLPDGPVLGGAPANFACQARRLGARAAIISAFGADALGQQARHQLDLLGVDHSAIATVPEQATGTAAVTIGPHGEPAYRIAEPAAWDFIPPLPGAFQRVVSADAICYGSLAQRGAVSRATIRAVIDAASPGCIRVFDINLRHPWIEPEAIVDLFERSNVVKLNESELDALAEILDLRGDEGERIEQLAARYRLRVVALTKGSSGCRLFADGQHVEHDGFPIEAVVDTVGVGDAFSAALILGLWQGLPLRAIAETSNRVAGQVCRQSGASVSIGSLS
jgi:fructokinase